MAYLFHVAVYQPIYNALALIVGVLPNADIGIGIVLITILVRLVLFPLSLSAIKSQIAMRRIDPELRALREQYRDDRETLGRKTMELFKANKVQPLAGFLLILIQLPVIFGLYAVLRLEARQVSFDPSVLYPFVHAPEHASLLFLGLVDLSGKSLVLAALVAVTQFLYARLLAPAKDSAAPAAKKSGFQEDFAKSMQLQMQYVLPVVIGAVAYFATSAIALYLAASNTFSVLQELVIQRVHGKR